MNQEEFKLLGEKIARNEATAEERLAFITELDSMVSEMRDDIKQLKQPKLNN
jgi:hypothetical protein